MNISTTPTKVTKLEFVRFFLNFKVVGRTWNKTINKQLGKTDYGYLPVFEWQGHHIAFNEDGDNIVYRLMGKVKFKKNKKDKKCLKKQKK